LARTWKRTAGAEESAGTPVEGTGVATIRPDPRSNERVRDLVLEHMRDGRWYQTAEVVGDAAWPDIVAVEWELKLLRAQGAAEMDDERRWRLSSLHTTGA
jgi:hypothetical protein